MRGIGGLAKGADYRGVRAPLDERAQARAQGFTGAAGYGFRRPRPAGEAEAAA